MSDMGAQRRIENMERTITELREQLTAAMKDAERYRWLRDNKHLDIWWSIGGEKDRCKNIDAAINAAMKKQP